MSDAKTKPYLKVVIISIIFISAMSIGIFVVMSSWLHNSATQYTETAEILDSFGDLAEADIQIILQEDAAKYETAYSSLTDLCLINNQYEAMIAYNVTHPLNYTQQDFDEVIIDFSLKMKLISMIVQSTSVYDYNVKELGADVTNNYSYMGEYYFIINQWLTEDNPLMDIHDDIREYVNTTFTLAGDPLDIPEIKFDRWTYHLYNNLSILEFVGSSKAVSYIYELTEDIGLSLVNLSLTQVADYRDGYITLIEKTDGITQDLNNTLITLALSAVLMGFATSFDNKNFRKISMIVGLIVLFLSIVYFTTAMSSFVNLASFEAQIIGINEFVFM